MAYALGIDVGSTNVKVGLVADDGTLVASARNALSSVVQAEAVEQDAEALWSAVTGTIRSVTAAAPAAARDTVAIGVASQYSSIVPVDAAGRAVAPLVMWRDRRGTDGADERREGLRSQSATSKRSLLEQRAGT